MDTLSYIHAMPREDVLHTALLIGNFSSALGCVLLGTFLTLLSKKDGMDKASESLRPLIFLFGLCLIVCGLTNFVDVMNMGTQDTAIEAIFKVLRGATILPTSIVTFMYRKIIMKNLGIN